MKTDTSDIQPAVFLDRDGVLNEANVRGGKPFSPVAPEDFVVIAGVSEMCEKLRRRGFALVVVTNQPDLARGGQTWDGIATFHSMLCKQVTLDAIYICPHDDADDCSCRKPKPGMLLAAAAELQLDLGRSFMVGDRWSDVEAGRRAGCRTVFVDHGYQERAPDAPDQAARDSVEALDWILGNFLPKRSSAIQLGGRT